MGAETRTKYKKMFRLNPKLVKQKLDGRKKSPLVGIWTTEIQTKGTSINALTLNVGVLEK